MLFDIDAFLVTTSKHLLPREGIEKGSWTEDEEQEQSHPLPDRHAGGGGRAGGGRGRGDPHGSYQELPSEEGGNNIEASGAKVKRLLSCLIFPFD